MVGIMVLKQDQYNSIFIIITRCSRSSSRHALAHIAVEGRVGVMAVREETEEEQSCGVDYLAFGWFVCRVGFIRISCWFDVELETIIGRSINATKEMVCQSANRSNVCLSVHVLSQNRICPDCVSVGFSFSVSRILTRLALAFEFFVFFFDFFYYFSLRKFGCHWCS